MTNIIVISFKEEAKAIDALHKLTELDSYGNISIYDKIMVRKKVNGEFELLKEDSFEGWRTLTGMTVGSLIGLLGGPVGFIIGLYSGTAIGAIAEISHYDFAEDFISKAKNKLEAGTIAIIAEIDEYSYTFIDATMQPFGAVISRSDVDYAFDNYMNEQIDIIDDDIVKQRAALKNAIGKDKAKIQDKIAELKEKRKATVAEFVNKAKATQKDVKDKTNAGFAKVKSGVTEFVNSVSNEINEERADSIRKRIVRYKDKLADLHKQLEELSPSMV